jgi:zinc protease
VGACSAALGQTGVERFQLDNGLKVILRPAAKSDSVACVVLFDIGEQHDPPGKSGLCHLVEHLYVTAAAGSTPAASAESWMARYQGMVNAQTGRAYTVIATVFPRDRLEQELAEAAARMGDLRMEPADLDRELPRMETELSNMYGGIPALTAMNLAASAVSPLPPGARKGGVMEQVRTITIDEARQWHARQYKPGRATLALAGGFDAGVARDRITAVFGNLSRGEQHPPPLPPGAASLGTVQRFAAGPQAPAVATIAYRAPEPGSELYAPFLILTARLVQQEMSATMFGRTPQFSVYYAPLDLPEVLTVSTEPKPGQSDAEVAALLRQRVTSGTAVKEGATVNRASLAQIFGPMLGLGGPQLTFGEDPYFAAFCLGRRLQLGLEGDALAGAVEAVSADDLRRCAADVFGPERSAVVVVRAE